MTKTTNKAATAATTMKKLTKLKKGVAGWLATFGLALGLAFVAAGPAAAESEGFAWDKAPNKTNDVAALQIGAKLFVNYCL
ncbi:MAG: putative cytochrome c1 PetC, partial [Variovorax sp.]|nr:putative cytochrome c1 PetC [Variovorax sp.]